MKEFIFFFSVGLQLIFILYSAWMLKSGGFKKNFYFFFPSCLFIIVILFETIFTFGANNKRIISNDESLCLLILTILFSCLPLAIWLIVKKLKETEKEKNEYKNLYTAIFQNSSNDIFLNDPEGRFIDIGEMEADFLEYTRDEMKNLGLQEICVSKHLKNMPEFVDKLKEGEFIFEADLRSKSGKMYPAEIKSRLINNFGKSMIISITHDISERKQIERKILNAIIETEHRERERFSKDLHDQLGNILSSMNIYCELIKSATIQEIEKENLMGYFKGLLNDAIASTKEIANNLNPGNIARFGLIVSVQGFCEKISKTGLLKIYFSTNLTEDSLSKDIEVNLYKIITELVNNTLKHASADRAYIAISLDNNILLLKYEDNGHGFDYEKRLKDKNNKGMGLLNITSRVAAIGGKISVESNKFIGTRVNIQTNII